MIVRKMTGVLAGVLVAVSLLAAQCPGDQSGGSGGGGTLPRKGQIKAQGAVCPAPGRQTGAKLPDLSGAGIEQIDRNPCLTLGGFAAKLTGFVASKKAEDPRTFDVFTTKLDTFVRRINKLNDLVTCAYLTDTLSVGVYQSTEAVWSVGAVAVFRGDLGRLVDNAACWVIKQLGLEPAPTQGILPPQIRFEVCAHGRTTDDGFAILWLGTSNFMCDALQQHL